MKFEHTIDIDAPAQVVWSTWADVEHWPDWTTTATSVERLDDGPFGRGSRVRLKQPSLPAANWVVTEYREGETFAWEYRAPGNRVVATHVVQPLEGGSTRATLRVEMSGLFPAVMRPWLSRLTRRNLEIEAAGLSAESRARAARRPLPIAG